MSAPRRRLKRATATLVSRARSLLWPPPLIGRKDAGANRFTMERTRGAGWPGPDARVWLSPDGSPAGDHLASLSSGEHAREDRGEPSASPDVGVRHRRGVGAARIRAAAGDRPRPRGAGFRCAGEGVAVAPRATHMGERLRRGVGAAEEGAAAVDRPRPRRADGELASGAPPGVPGTAPGEGVHWRAALAPGEAGHMRGD